MGNIVVIKSPDAKVVVKSLQSSILGTCPESEDPLVANVLLGVTYKIDDVDKVGELVVISPADILYQPPQLTGQTISYANNDDGWNLANGVYTYNRPANPLYVAELDDQAANPFITLKQINAFGTLDRFTDSVGGQDYDGTGGSLVDYVIDHLTRLGWYRLEIENVTWANSLIGATASTQNSFSDWRVPNFYEMASINRRDANVSNRVLNYPPWNETGFNNYWTSTTYQATTTGAYAQSWGGQFTGQAKTISTYEYFICRNHYV
jgi:hypothetical protein